MACDERKSGSHVDQSAGSSSWYKPSVWRHSISRYGGTGPIKEGTLS